MTSALILDEPPLVVQPSLVRLLGDHVSALFLQQVHYRAKIGQKRDGHRWAVATTDEWCADAVIGAAQFKRVVRHLGDLGVLISSQPGHYDRTSWRRVDYDALAAMMPEKSDRAETDLSIGQPADPAPSIDAGSAGSIGLFSTDVPTSREVRTEQEPKIRATTAFDDWWLTYPRKIGKPAAQRAWNRITRKGVDVDAVEVLVVALRQWNDHWTKAKTETQYVPHAATWLNQERYNDDPTVPSTRGRSTAPVDDDRGGSEGKVSNW